jgi:excisionase family DNA binding protein
MSNSKIPAPAVAGGIPRLLTLQQVANATSFSVRQIRRWIDSGELKACRFGRALRVAEVDLAIFITTKKHP